MRAVCFLCDVLLDSAVGSEACLEHEVQCLWPRERISFRTTLATAASKVGGRVFDFPSYSMKKKVHIDLDVSVKSCNFTPTIRLRLTAWAVP